MKLSSFQLPHFFVRIWYFTISTFSTSTEIGHLLPILRKKTAHLLIDFQGAQIVSGAGFPLFREVDERFSIVVPVGDALEGLRSPAHTKHTHGRMSRHRMYPIGCGYEDCNDGHFLRIDPALRLALGKSTH